MLVLEEGGEEGSRMRILIKERHSFVINEITEVEMDNDKSALYIPKQRMRYLTGDRTEELFRKLLFEGYADLSEINREQCVRQVLL